MQQLPRSEAILENTKVRFVDFDTLLADDFVSSVKGKNRYTGYLSITYHNHKDLLLIHEGQIKEALRFFNDHSRNVIKKEEVLDNIREDLEGLVNYFLMPVSFLDFLWYATIKSPSQEHIHSTFVIWDKYLAFIKRYKLSGFVELDNEKALSYISFKEGLPNDTFLGFTIEASQKFSIKFFNPLPPYFIPEITEIKLTFLDIFEDLLKTTYSIITQEEKSRVSASRVLNKVRKQYPVLLKGVHRRKTGSINFNIVLNNLEKIPPTQRRDTFVNCFIDILYQRLLVIKEIFGLEVLDRTLKELKLVQIYYQTSLSKHGLSDDLFSLWQKFEN